MKIITKKIKELKPDKNQPRKKINPEDIENLAKSFRHHGVINPIEIDKDNVIITGEMRWRGAKLAGLKEVPCKVLELDKNTRFLRQLTENIHHYDVDQWDLAKALKKALSLCPAEVIKRKGYDKGYSWLASRIGCEHAYIQEHIEILNPEIVSSEIQEGMKSGEIPYTMIRAIKRNKTIEKDILKGGLSRDEALKKAGFKKLNVHDRMAIELNNITMSGLIWNPKRAKEFIARINSKGEMEEGTIERVNQVKESILNIVEKWTEILKVIK